MRKDLQPNGGSSTKDQLNRIERDVREVRGKVDNHGGQGTQTLAPAIN